MRTSMKRPAKLPPPLTKDMQDALYHLETAEDRAFVRLYSQWWVRESDAIDGLGFREIRDTRGRLQHSGTPGEVLIVVRSTTVQALVTRRILSFADPVRTGNGWRGPVRAELVLPIRAATGSAGSVNGPLVAR